MPQKPRIIVLGWEDDVVARSPFQVTFQHPPVLTQEPRIYSPNDAGARGEQMQTDQTPPVRRVWHSH